MFSGFIEGDLDIESTAHYLLHFTTYITEWRTLLSTIENIDNNLLGLCKPVLLKTPLFGSNSFDKNANKCSQCNYWICSTTKRFEEPLFQWSHEIFKQGYESANSVFVIVVPCIICRFSLFS